MTSSGFTIKKIENLTQTYAENSSGDTLDNMDNQLHTPLLEIEKNISILQKLIEQEKITINSIYCIKD